MYHPENYFFCDRFKVMKLLLVDNTKDSQDESHNSCSEHLAIIPSGNVVKCSTSDEVMDEMEMGDVSRHSFRVFFESFPTQHSRYHSKEHIDSPQSEHTRSGDLFWHATAV